MNLCSEEERCTRWRALGILFLYRVQANWLSFDDQRDNISECDGDSVTPKVVFAVGVFAYYVDFREFYELGYMVGCECQLHQFSAFFALQIERYLEFKELLCDGSPAEGSDDVVDVLGPFDLA